MLNISVGKSGRLHMLNNGGYYGRFLLLYILVIFCFKQWICVTLLSRRKRYNLSIVLKHANLDASDFR